MAAGAVLAARDEREPGWKSVALHVGTTSAPMLEVRADSVWTPRASANGSDPRLLGVRLAEVPAGAGAAAGRSFRYRLGEDGEVNDLLRMGGKTGDEFARAWKETLEGKTRFGHRFRLYREAKLALREQPFRAEGEYAAVARLVETFRDRGAAVVLVNSPESPWILGEYRDSGYYQGYLRFFRELASSPGVTFYDWSDALPPEDFNDWHHPSYIGSIKLGERYAGIVQDALSADGAGRAH
jgi:hypothetical protein